VSALNRPKDPFHKCIHRSSGSGFRTKVYMISYFLSAREPVELYICAAGEPKSRAQNAHDLAQCRKCWRLLLQCTNETEAKQTTEHTYTFCVYLCTYAQTKLYICVVSLEAGRSSKCCTGRQKYQQGNKNVKILSQHTNMLIKMVRRKLKCIEMHQSTTQ
jgi:hypothetical protein